MNTLKHGPANRFGTNSAKSRIIGYDFARALAIFGMVVVNFKIVMGASEAGPSWFVWLVGLLEGRAAATFVILAGVGLSLLSNRLRIANDQDGMVQNRITLLKRALFLFAVGLLYTPIWPADILHFYGIYIALGAFLLGTTGRRLWTLAFVFMVIFVVLLFFFDYEQGWNWETLVYTGFWTPAGMMRHLLFNGFHPVFPWTAFLVVGIWLGRQDMSNRAHQKRILLASVGVVCIAEVASWLLIHTFSSNAPGADTEVVKYLFGTGPMPPMPLYLLSGGGTALVVITLSIMLTERIVVARLFEPFIITGQLALTHYVAHVLIGMVLLEVFGLLENRTLSFAVASAGTFCAGAVLFSVFWRKRFNRGPLEWVMRRLTT